jgi:hypothetical protein
MSASLLSMALDWLPNRKLGDCGSQGRSWPAPPAERGPRSARGRHYGGSLASKLCCDHRAWSEGHKSGGESGV